MAYSPAGKMETAKGDPTHEVTLKSLVGNLRVSFERLKTDDPLRRSPLPDQRYTGAHAFPMSVTLLLL